MNMFVSLLCSHANSNACLFSSMPSRIFLPACKSFQTFKPCAVVELRVDHKLEITQKCVCSCSESNPDSFWMFPIFDRIVSNTSLIMITIESHVPVLSSMRPYNSHIAIIEINTEIFDCDRLKETCQITIIVNIGIVMSKLRQQCCSDTTSNKGFV